MKEIVGYSQELTKFIKSANGDIQGGIANMQSITIAIREEGEEKPKYSAKLKLDGDWTEEVPKNPPSENDVYWVRFKENVNKIRDERKEIMNKAIEVAGSSISKVINPISFSTLDIVKLVEMINTMKK